MESRRPGFNDATEFERDTRIVAHSFALADIAREAVHKDAGAALIRAALVCWEPEYSREGALAPVRTTLTGVYEPIGSGLRQPT